MKKLNKIKKAKFAVIKFDNGVTLAGHVAITHFIHQEGGCGFVMRMEGVRSLEPSTKEKKQKK